MLKIKNWRGSTKKKAGILVGLCAAFAILQVLLATDAIGSHMKGLLPLICINIMLAVSLNLTVGVLGELSLGHAGFMCVGAYVGSLVSVMTAQSIEQWWLRFPIALIAGGLVAALFGLLIGIPVLRLRGDYLAIVTLAFGEIIYNLCAVLFISKDVNGLHMQMGGTGIDGLDPLSTVTIANGAQGIPNLPRIPHQDETLFIIGFVLVIITVWLSLNLIHSRAGRAVKAIRDNRIAAESIGINISKHKLIILVFSAFFAGVAGVMYAQKAGQMMPTAPNTYNYVMSINILVFVVLGGMGSTLGSIVAAVALTVLPEWLRFLSDYRMLIYAIVLIVVMLANHNDKFQALLAKGKSLLTFKSKTRNAEQKGGQ